MHRMFAFLALTAVGAGLYMLFVAPDPDPIATAAQSSVFGGSFGYGGWAIGLMMGLTLAWLARVEWSMLPERLAAWLRLQRRRLGWAMLGGVFAAILLLF